jgi:hypothetical protein
LRLKFSASAHSNKIGYNFSIIDIISGFTFCATAIPETHNVTGVRSFCLCEDGVLRVDAEGGDIRSRKECLRLPATKQ